MQISIKACGKTPFKYTCMFVGGGGLGLSYTVLEVKKNSFFVVGKANRPSTCMTYRHRGRDRFGLAEGRGQVTE